MINFLNFLSFLFFTFVSNFFLLLAFNKDRIFIDFFLGLFLWLGFWYKYSISLLLGTGYFDEFLNGEILYVINDEVLNISSVAFIALIIARFIRAKIWNYPIISNKNEINENIVSFYIKYRDFILLIFIFSVCFFSFTNSYLGIYQKGFIAKTHLPLGLNNLYKCLILFGFTALSAIIIYFELLVKKQISNLILMIVIGSELLISFSLLSRGSIINIFALAYGALFMSSQLSIKIKLVPLKIILILSLIFLIILSINFLRINSFKDHQTELKQGFYENIYHLKKITKPLLIDRWVGIESLMALVTSKQAGWDLWYKAWEEKYDVKETSLYDRIIFNSPYRALISEKNHFITAPGFVTFFSYPGSLVFLFFSVLTVYLFSSIFEIFTYYSSKGNIILCSVFSYIISYRFASFGYVPRQSYLLFGSLFIFLIIIFFLNKKFNNRNF